MERLYVYGILALLVAAADAQLMTQPQQVHLAYGEDPTQMSVSWVTMSPTPSSLVEYGINGFQMYAKGNQTTFTDGGSAHRLIYVHHVVLTGLIPGQRYVYHCGSQLGFSDLFFMQAMPAGSNWHVRLAVFGDLGNVNPQSLSRLQRETQQGMYDAILHVGDFAYNMDSSNALVGDSFMRQIEAVAAYVPYMTCVGNHEQAYNFSNYKARFNMPKAGGDGENIFYSFNMGPAHIIAFSTEVYFYTAYGTDVIANQLAWLKKDLATANLPENRAKQPWIITMGHRPMYCSNSDHDDCTKYQSLVRTELEDLFYSQGVDLTFWAHEHSYERLWPIYNMTMCNGSDTAPFTNPTGPVHITTGSAGCQEDHDGFQPIQPPWTAFRSEDYGYTRLNIVNSTHIMMEQVSDDKNGAIIDSMTLIKEKHGAGTYTCHQKARQASQSGLKQTKHLNLQDETVMKGKATETKNTDRERLTFKSMRQWQETFDEQIRVNHL